MATNRRDWWGRDLKDGSMAEKLLGGLDSQPKQDEGGEVDLETEQQDTGEFFGQNGFRFRELWTYLPLPPSPPSPSVSPETRLQQEQRPRPPHPCCSAEKP